MLLLCGYIYKYFKLYRLITSYIQSELKDENILDNIVNQINICGPVAIKLTQWLLPKIEIMISSHDNIRNNIKSPTSKNLETLYENCLNHPINDTKIIYQKSFNTQLNDDYDIISILGSGSIGQVYHIKNKENEKEYVMKIIHPNVREDISLFQKMYQYLNILLKIFPCITNYISLFPFDINNFINDFNHQSNFINETNNILQFYHYFKDNPFIIIPEVYKCSQDIIIMSYEPGEYIHDLKNIEDNYLKYSVSILYYLFVNNNEQCYHFNHGDLHQGNWRYRIEDNKPRIIIYDFGFCFSIPEDKRYIVSLIVDTFEKTDKIHEDSVIETLTNISEEILIGYQKTSENRKYLKNYINENVKKIKPWAFSPVSIIKIFIDFSISENCKINHLLLQFFIIAIQCNQLYEEFSFKGSDENIINGYSVYRERYIDVINYCQTNHIFKDYQKLIQKKVNENQPKINDLFDTIQMSEDIKLLAIN